MEEDNGYRVGIFMRFAQTTTLDGRRIDGFETMELYAEDAAARGYTWFSTDSLAHGMGVERVRQFQKALERGETVPVYFMVIKAGGGTNQIEYTAHLLDLESSAEPLPCPEGKAPGTLGNVGRIRLKSANLQRQQLVPSGFTVDGPGTNLADAVAKGMFQFGYISRNSAGAPELRLGLTEVEVVEKFLGYLEASGFRFSRKLVLDYWISLKTKPFAILADLSGSGKSKLPLLVAWALGAEFCQVAVSPGWTEDSDLLGYQNPLDPAGTFQLTDFTAFLLEAHRDQQDRLWFVCLDDMNFARVEHCFAKFLSAFEGLGEEDRVVRLHNGSAPRVPRSVAVQPSSFFTGTVNMDETTHTFSPNVLDRANLIESDAWPEDLRADLPCSVRPWGTPEPHLL